MASIGAFLKSKTAFAHPRNTSRWDVFLWGLLTTALAVSHLLLWVIATADGYGFATFRTGNNFTKLQHFNTFAIQLPLNVLAGIMVFGSDYVRRSLLAPPVDEDRNPGAKIGYQSYAAWKRVGNLRRILWLILIVSSLPLHLLYNSITLAAEPAHDAYEILVDERFFSGMAFNVSTLNMTQFASEPGAPMPYGTRWPDEWPGSSELQKMLEGVQNNSSSWENLTNPDCRGKYGLDIYSTYRTVILVTGWSQLMSLNDSALALGALPGIPPVGVPDRFLSMCPTNYPGAVNDTSYGGDDSFASYIGTSDLPPCEIAGGTDCTQTSDDDGGWSFVITDNNWNACDSSYLHYVSLLYCLSEPISVPSRLAWSKFITEIVTITLFVKAIAMAAAWLCLRFDRGFTDGYPWSSLQDRKTLVGGTKFAYRSVNVAICIFTMYVAMGIWLPFRSGSTPSSSADKSFILNLVVFTNLLHTLMVIREAIETNFFEKAEVSGRRLRTRNWSYGEKSTGIYRKRCFIPRAFVMFVWYLLLHQTISAWFGVAMFDHYKLDSVRDPTAPSVPTLILQSTMSNNVGMPFQGSLTGIFGGIFFPVIATTLQIFCTRLLFKLCMRYDRDKSLPCSL